METTVYQIEHEEEIHIFHKFMDLLLSSILNNTVIIIILIIIIIIIIIILDVARVLIYLNIFHTRKGMDSN